MQKEAGFFDFFKNRKKDIYTFIDQNIDPQVEELRKILGELKSLSRNSPEAAQLFWNMKEIFYQIQSLKQSIYSNTKTAQVTTFTPRDRQFYMKRLSDILKNLMLNSKSLFNLVEDDRIKKQIYQSNKIINENIYMLDNYEKEQEQNHQEQPQDLNDTSKHPTIPFDYQQHQQVIFDQLPNFFKNFVKSLDGYDQYGKMVDIEAIRGIMSTWLRNHGLSLLNKSLGEFKSRYIPLEVFVKLINGEQVERTDKRKLKDRRVEPST